MGDYFKEQIVKKQNCKSKNIKNFFIYFICGFIGLISIAIIPIIGIFVAGAIGFGIYLFYTRQNQEFEYVITNNNFDIDVIYNRSKRKQVLSLDIKEIQLMTYVSNKGKENEFRNITKTLDFSSGVNNENTMHFITTIKGEKTIVVIEPNENILDGIKIYLHSRILILDK